MRKITGGIDSVRVVKFPMGMKEGGDPSTELLAEGPPGGPKQFELPDERMITNRRERNYFPIPDGTFDAPISSEPEFSTKPGEFNVLEGQNMKEFLFTTPTIRPQEVYPMDPDPGMVLTPSMPQPQGGGIPSLINASMTKPNGILSINKVYDI